MPLGRDGESHYRSFKRFQAAQTSVSYSFMRPLSSSRGHVPLVYHVINIDNSDSKSDAAVADTDTSPRAALKADINDADEVAVGLTALQVSLEPEDPALRSFPSRLFNMGMSGVDLASPYFRDLLSDTPIEGAEQFQGFGSR
ncbi:hypothetical protein GGX14DRAFT_396313 [Mycena pura]|uniref:Uncharacterized protein n=1 Tax=Mycena pura TaxID=153505 RepID=A0AAD6VAE6_9AGAR|nr:hypothetical protein GGX14DRAFT_396313 [Mycena pura]